ncbi:hypothetical protein D3C73_1458680 [compost metagenome]
MDRAGTDDHQQAWITAFKNGAYRLAVLFNLVGEGIGQRQLLLERVRAGETLADGAVGRLRLGQGQSERRRLHGDFSLGGRRVLTRAVGPIEVFDKEPDWHSVW